MAYRIDSDCLAGPMPGAIGANTTCRGHSGGCSGASDEQGTRGQLRACSDAGHHECGAMEQRMKQAGELSGAHKA